MAKSICAQVVGAALCLIVNCGSGLLGFAPGLADHGLTQGAAPASSSATMRADTSA